MYRYNQTLPGGPLTLVGVFALSLLIPGWAAAALGLGALHGQLTGWIFSHHGFSCFVLVVLYDVLGFLILAGCGIAIYVGYFVVVRAVVGMRNGAVRASIASARLLIALLYRTYRGLYGWLRDRSPDKEGRYHGR